jgi:Na+/melibiose symporter-like transporter
MMFNGVFFGIFIAGNYKIINLENLSDKVLTMAGAIGAVGNAISRILCSSLQDKYGFKRIYGPILIIQLITSVMMYHFRESSVLYTIFVFLAFFSEGAHFAMFPTVAVNIFGVENGG